VPTFGHPDLRPSLVRVCSSSGARFAHRTVHVNGAQQFSGSVLHVINDLWCCRILGL
jgi:hypothetical protein